MERQNTLQEEMIERLKIITQDESRIKFILQVFDDLDISEPNDLNYIYEKELIDKGIKIVTARKIIEEFQGKKFLNEDKNYAVY